ncbi:hypothetical protein WN51_08440 [Melipona quadrifasciata]|uniref:Uncharacterized protein n=1 Tax=Melipona quadrifasciata TaxID=166423 RepID=A0A0M9AC57_9HYME|nr:hypothetical protein WN51_08440 [Melipona quadrifasciata]
MAIFSSKKIKAVFISNGALAKLESSSFKVSRLNFKGLKVFKTNVELKFELKNIRIWLLDDTNLRTHFVGFIARRLAMTRRSTKKEFFVGTTFYLADATGTKETTEVSIDGFEFIGVVRLIGTVRPQWVAVLMDTVLIVAVGSIGVVRLIGTVRPRWAAVLMDTVLILAVCAAYCIHIEKST